MSNTLGYQNIPLNSQTRDLTKLLMNIVKSNDTNRLPRKEINSTRKCGFCGHWSIRAGICE